MPIQKSFMGFITLLLIFNLNLFSQIVLQGNVTSAGMDPEPVQNALVELIDQADTSRSFNSKTDEKGHYTIQLTETAIGDVSVQKPGAFQLFQNYPNPFNPSTVITYECPHPADVRIEIYNILGQKIKTLYDGFQSNLLGRVIWDGTNDLGQGVSAGVYIYSLTSENIRINKKMLLLDGHSGNSNAAFSHTINNVLSHENALNKSLSNTFLLRVSGIDIEPWERQNLQITGDMVVDVSVYRTVTDIDGNVYRTVKIGDQWWMAENLKSTHYRNSDVLSGVKDNTEWINQTSGACCYYDNDSSYAAVYGALYNWYAIADSRNIAPEGWHVPMDEEWKQLEIYLGMIPTEADSTGGRGTEEGGILKEAGTLHWNSPNIGATNKSGFTALPGGYRRCDNGDFVTIGDNATFWSAVENDSADAWIRMLRHFNAGVDRFSSDKLRGFSVRCVKDGSAVTLNNIRITPASDTLRNRETRRFTCTAIFSNQSAKNVTNLAKWSVSPGTAGSIDAIGRFTAHDTHTGLETITATYKSRTAHAKVSVIVRETGSLTDIDGNVYRTVKIGDQWWMAQNLKVTHYRNGDAIPCVINYIEWADLTTPAYCYYNNASSYAAVYGALYNWYAVNDSRNIAPEGWHVPSDEEWQKLVDHLGGNAVAGGKMKERGTAHWVSPNIGATNESGFTALPGGYRAERTGTFWSMGRLAYFWSNTSAGNNIAWERRLLNHKAIAYRDYHHKQYGCSIRLVRD